ncbi:MAG: hypothetical protein J6P84_05270 [Alphaproteobacteria bacterium]|nr:hypothetical protein [Alphaproteobacteria bacterium]
MNGFDWIFVSFRGRIASYVTEKSGKKTSNFGAARAESSLLELCRVVTEFDSNQIKQKATEMKYNKLVVN